MKIKEIIESIQSARVNITHHAREEAKNDLLFLEDVFFSSCNGEIIEDYPSDNPYPSCLVFGKTSDGDPVHCVWGYESESKIAILITVYRPDPNLWINWKQRKK